MVGEIPLHALGCLFGYAFAVAEEVAGSSAVIDFVELVDVIGEFAVRVLFLDSLAVCIIAESVSVAGNRGADCFAEPSIVFYWRSLRAGN